VALAFSHNGSSPRRRRTIAFDGEQSPDASDPRDRFATIAIARASVDHVAASGAKQ
jgi:hypothetical protein